MAHLIQEGSKLTGAGENGEGRFGFSVALSADGNTALIGGYSDNGGIGAVWVFTRSSAGWTQGPKLTGGGESGPGLFGHSVALSADGNTALIGGPYDNGKTGAAWVFTRSGTTWTQQGEKLTGGGESGPGLFGASVALSADGNTALIGGEADQGVVSEDHGAAWVFTRSGTTWTQQGEKLTGSGEVGGGQVRSGHFGHSVALSADGNTALIGGYGDNSGNGAAWVFTRSGTTWTQQGEKLTGGMVSRGGGFGGSVALSADGNTALIGAPEYYGSSGAVWVFTRSGTTWTQQGEKFTGTGKIGASAFGTSVALSADGNTALIGGSADHNNIGAMWVFTRSGTTWTQQGEKLTGSGTNGQSAFGFDVALSAEANTALVGGYEDSTNIGAAWLFVNLAPTVTPTTSSTATATPPAPPVITDVTQSHRRWREGSALASFARRHAHGPKLPPLGTTFSFALSERANVSFAFTRPQRGGTIDGRCVPRTRGNRDTPVCTLVATRRTLTFAAHSGTNAVVFQGRDSYSKRLAPGRYTLVIAATNANGHSSDASLAFTIVK